MPVLQDLQIHSYESADAYLGARAQRTLSRNTILRRHGEGIQVVLHWTPVVTYQRDGHITLCSGGWHSPTTRRRIQQFIPPRYRVYVHRRQMFLMDTEQREDWGKDRPFNRETITFKP